MDALAARRLRCDGDGLEEECAALAAAHGLDPEDLARECDVFSCNRRAALLGLGHHCLARKMCCKGWLAPRCVRACYTVVGPSCNLALLLFATRAVHIPQSSTAQPTLTTGRRYPCWPFKQFVKGCLLAAPVRPPPAGAAIRAPHVQGHARRDLFPAGSARHRPDDPQRQARRQAAGRRAQLQPRRLG